MGFLKNIGVFLASVKGWLFVASLMPAAATYFFGWLEGLSISAAIAYSMLSLASGLGLVALGIWIWEHATAFFTTRREQTRIANELRGLKEDGITELSTGDIAAILAGTRDENDINRHLRFRRIKSAINNGEINNPVYKDIGTPGLPNYKRKEVGKPPLANLMTWVSLAKLEEYLIKIGVLDRKDTKDGSHLSL